MSVAGARSQVAREVPEYSNVPRRGLLITRGITGPWQVSGRSDSPPEEAIRLNSRPVPNRSMTGDIAIVLRTVGVVLRPAGTF